VTSSVGGLFGSAGGSSLLGAAGNYLTGNMGGGFNNSGLTSQFAGTPLANNTSSFNAYNAANGPTSSDISNITGSADQTGGSGLYTPSQGIGNINVGSIDQSTLGDFNNSLNLPSDTSDDLNDLTDFLGDGF
jgi:hypothetical protein